MGEFASELLRFSPADELTMLFRLLVAAVAGGIVGYERRTTGHYAGIRTLSLVSMGAAVFTVASIYGFRVVEDEVVRDPARVAAQVASGVGFLGAGTIILLGRTVRGLTTAAAIWMTAALGLAAGAGLVVLALAGALLTAAVLRFFPRGSDVVSSARAGEERFGEDEGP
jgi:putative Mg2+ transporter-C (MgtC) family protein